MTKEDDGYVMRELAKYSRRAEEKTERQAAYDSSHVDRAYERVTEKPSSGGNSEIRRQIARSLEPPKRSMGDIVKSGIKQAGHATKDYANVKVKEYGPKVKDTAKTGLANLSYNMREINTPQRPVYTERRDRRPEMRRPSQRPSYPQESYSLVNTDFIFGNQQPANSRSPSMGQGGFGINTDFIFGNGLSTKKQPQKNNNGKKHKHNKRGKGRSITIRYD